MAATNFGLLTSEQLLARSKTLWKHARNQAFITKFLGSGPGSMITHVTELKQSEKGARAMMTLLHDLEGDGVAGDRQLLGNEEALKTNEVQIRIDQIRHANRTEGRMADQKSAVEFRNNSKDLLAYWLADRMDQMAFLALAGIGFQYKNSALGVARTGSDLINLEFAADVSAGTDKRYFRWDGTNKALVAANTAAMVAADTPSYEMLVQLKAYAKENYIRGIRSGSGEETYHVFLSPMAMAKLKMETNYMQNLRYAQTRGDANELFTGTSVKIDGLMLHEFRHVPNTRATPSGSKWGGAGTIDGCAMLFCGAQALGMADLGDAGWEEEKFDYNNSYGISTNKILGFLKPKFHTPYSGNTVQDFGVIRVDVTQ